MIWLLLAAVGVPAILVAIAWVALWSDEKYPCPCDYCEREEERL